MIPLIEQVKKNNRLYDLIHIHSDRADKKNLETNGDVMVDVKRNRGKCECCLQDDIAVKKVNGIMACSMCSTVQARIKKFPGEIVAEISRLVGDDFFPRKTGMDDLRELEQLDDLFVQVGTLTSAAADMTSKISELENERDMFEARVNVLTSKLLAADDQISRLQDDNMDLMVADGGDVIPAAALEIKSYAVGSIEADVEMVVRLVYDRPMLEAINILAKLIGRSSDCGVSA